MKKPFNEAAFRQLVRSIIREEFVDIQQDIDLPKPLSNGENKLPAGQYEMDLTPDKRQYIWTDPETKERVGIPVTLIQQMEQGEEAIPPGEEQTPETGTSEQIPEQPPQQ